MTDKVQEIKDWISKEQDDLMDANGNFEYPEHEGAYHILYNLDAYINSFQEESVSEDLQSEIDYLSKRYPEVNAIECTVKADYNGLYTTETWDDMTDLLNKINAKAGDKVKLVIVKQ